MIHWYQNNTQSQEQNGRYFAADISKSIFLKKTYCVFVQNSRKIVPIGPTGKYHCPGALLVSILKRNKTWRTQNAVRSSNGDCEKSHTMDLLWEKFLWILPLYMKPISFQSKASVVCSVTAAIFIDFCLKKLYVFSNILVEKTNEYLNSTEQIPRNWNIDQRSVFITFWDIIQWYSINLLWKELMERMSEHTGLISSYQLLITAACTNTGGKMKGSHPRAADQCPFVLRPWLSQVTSFMQLGMLLVCPLIRELA